MLQEEVVFSTQVLFFGFRNSPCLGQGLSPEAIGICAVAGTAELNSQD